MSTGTEATEAIVLRAEPHGERFLQLVLLLPEDGVGRALIRASTKPQTRDFPGFLDRGHFEFDPGKGGGVRFVRSFELAHRPDGLGRGYARLQAAAALASFMELNVPHMDGSHEAWQSLLLALQALEAGAHPQSVQLKALFRIALREGYPVREHWLRSLPESARGSAETLIRTPLAELAPEAAKSAGSLLESFKRFLVGETEFRV